LSKPKRNPTPEILARKKQSVRQARAHLNQVTLCLIEAAETAPQHSVRLRRLACGFDQLTRCLNAIAQVIDPAKRWDRAL
jgi:hypothetical protein